MQNAIEFNNVWKKFKKGEKHNSIRDALPNFFKNLTSKEKKAPTLEEQEFWAVKNVSFQIKPGEVVGFIGPNGAGKSTILKLLSRIMNPNIGSLKINGRLSALIEVTAGFHPELTGRENVYLNGTILGMKRNELDSKFDAIVDFSGLREFIDTPVKRYSSGMFSRLGFSVAAHVDPDVLLVDEVLAVGDMAFQSKCAMKMRELMKAGTTIMLVSHNLQLVQSLCNRIIMLHRGEILVDGTPENVIPRYEEVINQQKEDEFKKSIDKSDYKVKVTTEESVEITQLDFTSKTPHARGHMQYDDELKIKLQYYAKNKIINPVFVIDIIRNDGVLCCSSNTKDSQTLIPAIEGKGEIKINLGKLNLAPGVYAIKASIWDKDFIHPYAIRKNDVVRFESQRYLIHTESVFLPNIQWEV